MTFTTRVVVMGCLAAAATEAWAEDGTSHRVSIDAESSLEGAGYGGSIAYSGRVAPSLFAGGGAGFGWEENRSSFDVNVFNAIHGDAFVRYEPVPFFHVDAGLTAMQFATADDSGLGGSGFLGGYATASVGYRYVFVSTRLRAGTAVGELGTIVTPVMVRAVVPW